MALGLGMGAFWVRSNSWLYFIVRVAWRDNLEYTFLLDDFTEL